MLEHNKRYLQLAFNDSLASAQRIVPRLAYSDRILIEAGTPFVKQAGMGAIEQLRSMWRGHIVADIKVTDGAADEVDMAHDAGATAITVMGSAPTETLNLFIKRCRELGMASMVDLLGVPDPLHVLRRLREPPTVMVLHRGRDEESTRGKMIQYRHVKRILSKYDVLISAAGGVDLKEARSAIFNGANIVVVNIVRPGTPWEGIPLDGDVPGMARKFMETIE
jgi:3-keto-L-gulonate-6-phosphate decarboxylase